VSPRPARRWAAVAAVVACAGCVRYRRSIPLLDAPVLLTAEPAALMPATPLPVGRGVDRLCVTVPNGWTRSPERGALVDRAGREAVLAASITLGDGRILGMRFAGFRGGPAGGYCLAAVAPGADPAAAAPALPSPVIALRVWSSAPVRVTQIHWIDTRRPAGDPLSAAPPAPPPTRRR
jgi:hypothetical protein